MNRYLIGTAVLGGDVTIPKAGITYTDAETVRAVQTALKEQGFNPGTIDGVFGPKTSAAIKAMQAARGGGQTGVIDYGVLAALGVQAPSGSSASAAPSTSSAPSLPSGGYAQIFRPTPTVATPAPAQQSGWMMEPLWPGAPVKRWQAIFGGAAGLLAAFGIAAVVRR